jgi:hypothetical protein
VSKEGLCFIAASGTLHEAYVRFIAAGDSFSTKALL